MGSQRDCTWILGLPGFRVTTIKGEDSEAQSRLRVTWSDAVDDIRAVGVVDGLPCAVDEGADLG